MTDSIIKGASLLDHADWRLIIYIAPGEMRAYLKNIVVAEEPMHHVADAKWKSSDSASELALFQNCIYDRPALMDDYEADIIIDTDKTLFVPTKSLFEPGDAEVMYSEFFPAEESDIFADEIGGATCLYSPMTGMKPFVERTFAGARVRSSLSVLTGFFLSRAEAGRRLYAGIESNRVSIIAIDDNQLLCSAERTFHAPMDIVYHIMNTFDVFGFRKESDKIYVSGSKEIRDEILSRLRQFVAFAAITPLPRLAQTNDVPLSVVICALKPTEAIRSNENN